MSKLCVLRKAREIISDPTRWIQRELSKDSEGRWVNPEDPTAACWCSVGAIYRAQEDCGATDEERNAAWVAIEQAESCGLSSLAFFNDTHTHAEVLEAFDRAIQAANSDSKERPMSKLTIDDIEVPEGMFSAIYEGTDSMGDDESWHDYTQRTLAAALLWLSENPIVPSEEERREILGLPTPIGVGSLPYTLLVATEWQRRMFLRKPAALPEEVKKLLWDADGSSAGTLGGYPYFNIETYNDRIRQAYELGKAGAK